MGSKGRSGRGGIGKRWQRPAPSRSQRKAILIALEDAKSARLYFEGYKEETKNSRLVVIRHDRSDPGHVVALAKKTSDDRSALAEQGEADAFDEVWVVLDTEGPQNEARIKRAREAIAEAKKSGFRTAVSNPCFEYWLLLHFEANSASFQDCAAVCRRLETHIKDYSKSKSIYKLTRGRLNAALDRAESRLPDAGAEGGRHPCDVHPCTEVHRLVRSLLQ